MTIRKQILSILIIMLISLIILFYVTSRLIILKSFVALEEQQVQDHMKRLRNAIFDDFDALSTFVYDWDVWDDTYEFVEALNDSYIQSNLVDTAFTNPRLNIILYFNAKGQMIYGRNFDLEHEEYLPLSQGFQAHLTEISPLLDYPDTESKVMGLLLLPEDPMIVASRPILTSVLANPLQVEQIIINLCKNAIHAMPAQQGIIEICLDEHVQRTGIENEWNTSVQKYLRLTIKDNGSGMSSDVKEQIFDPFFTTKEVGAGLGLSVVHGIIQQHGGKIRVDSEPGQGTLFEILFPVIPETPLMESPKKIALEQTLEAPQSLVVKEHILILDNDSKDMRLPVMALEKLGYTVTVINDSHEALDIFRDRPDHFHLVMIALTLPEKRGVQTCRDIVNIRSDIPLIIYTEAHTSFNSKDIGEIRGAKFLRKPLKVRQLIQTVREILVIS